jgi:hypothetical protein
MVAESIIADPIPGAEHFKQVVPSSELDRHRLAPRIKPTYFHGELTFGGVSRMGAVASGSPGRGPQGGGGADSGAIGDDDNAASRGPGPAQQAIRSGRHPRGRVGS